MKIAAIDIGTNSFLCLVAEGKNGEIQKVISDQVEVVRLGEGVHEARMFSAAALERAENCLKTFRETVKTERVTIVKGVATSAARDVKNGNALIALGAKYGIAIEVISGQEEARLTFDGATYELGDPEGLAIVDVGGGSTELLMQKDGKLVGESLDIGCVRLTEIFVKHDPVDLGEVMNMQNYIREKVSQLPQLKARKIVAVAGTPTALVCAQLKKEFDESLVNGFVLSKKMLDHWLEKLAALKVSERAKLVGMNPKRADVVLAGTIILRESLNIFGADEMTVSTKGLRFGLARQILSEEKT